jgi:hypothetical protein
MAATCAAHSVLAEATAFLVSSTMPPPPCILDLNSIARLLPDGCAATAADVNVLGFDLDDNGRTTWGPMAEGVFISISRQADRL